MIKRETVRTVITTVVGTWVLSPLIQGIAGKFVETKGYDRLGASYAEQALDRAVEIASSPLSRFLSAMVLGWMIFSWADGLLRRWIVQVQKARAGSSVRKGDRRLLPMTVMFVCLVGFVVSAVWLMMTREASPVSLGNVQPAKPAPSVMAATFPTKLPNLATRYDKEEFRAALAAMSDLLNKKAKEMLRESGQPAVVTPLIDLVPGTPENVLTELEKIRALYSEVNAGLFMKGHGSVFEKYPDYEQALSEIIPLGTQGPWWAYSAGLFDFERAVRIVRDSPTSDTVSNAFDAQRRWSHSAEGVRELVNEAVRRINLMVEAIPQ